MKLTYAVVFEQTPNNYCASVPDVPGCVDAADSWDEMRAMIREALAFHIEGLLEQGEPLPEPKLSIDEAIAYHNEPIPEDVLGRGSSLWRSRSRPRRPRNRDDTGPRHSPVGWLHARSRGGPHRGGASSSSAHKPAGDRDRVDEW